MKRLGALLGIMALGTYLLFMARDKKKKKKKAKNQAVPAPASAK